MPAPTYVQIFDMQNDATLKKQVTVACRNAAVNILNELATAPNHVNRLRWAQWIQAGNVPVLFDRMMASVCQNSTLQASAATSGPYLDSDVQFVVNSNVDIQANAPGFQ